MAAGGESGAADVADDLSLVDALTYTDDVPAGVVVARGHILAADVAVVDHQPLAITGVVVALRDPTLPGEPGLVCHSRRPSRCHRAVSSSGAPGESAFRTRR